MSEESILECSAKKVTKTKVTIINIYRPPSRDVQSFLRILDNILNDKDKILLGDFNINQSRKSTQRNLFLDLLKTYDLYLSITETSRVTSTRKTTIDNIFTNSDSFKSYSWTSALSDHLARGISLMVKESTDDIVKIHRRIFSKISLELIRNELGLIDWEEILLLDDVNM
ncbi:Endonuclease-reverse transcriptase [Popillia japonica]|uniref:Endonuclease-reverse transcriptase n=1 Tax=Popillia japonica TaxID=7064 RepID=A0AAW1J0D6_POPJA